MARGWLPGQVGPRARPAVAGRGHHHGGGLAPRPVRGHVGDGGVHLRGGGAGRTQGQVDHVRPLLVGPQDPGGDVDRPAQSPRVEHPHRQDLGAGGDARPALAVAAGHGDDAGDVGAVAVGVAGAGRPVGGVEQEEGRPGGDAGAAVGQRGCQVGMRCPHAGVHHGHGDPGPVAARGQGTGADAGGPVLLGVPRVRGERHRHVRGGGEHAVDAAQAVDQGGEVRPVHHDALHPDATGGGSVAVGHHADHGAGVALGGVGQAGDVAQRVQGPGPGQGVGDGVTLVPGHRPGHGCQDAQAQARRRDRGDHPTVVAEGWDHGDLLDVGCGWTPRTSARSGTARRVERPSGAEWVRPAHHRWVGRPVLTGALALPPRALRHPRSCHRQWRRPGRNEP